MILNSQNGLPIEFTQGDTATLSLIATDDQNNPINLTGATFQTQIQGANPNGPITFQNAQHTLGNQTTNPGTFTLALADTDTPNCGEGSNKEIITQVVIAGAVTYFRGVSLLTVYPSVPLQ